MTESATDGLVRDGVLKRLRRALSPHRHPVLHPSASFSATMRVRLENHPGAFAALAEAIGDAGGLLGAIDLVRVGRGHKVRDVTFLAADAAHVDRILAAVRHVHGIEVEHISDRTFLAHLGGKLEVTPRTPLKTRDDLSIAYTPGVGRVSSAIAEDPSKVWSLTIKQNTVAVVSDGTAVLGLGDIGPEGALPVMEGKAVLFKEFGGVDAWPVCLATKDVDEIVRTVTAIAPVFGGINLEDISAPRCFEVERRLRETLDIPVFHDDQHGTAIVVLAVAPQRPTRRRQGARVGAHRDHRRRRGRDRSHEDAARRGRARHRRLRPGGRALPRPAGPHPGKGGIRRADEPTRAAAARPTRPSKEPTSTSASRRREPSAPTRFAGWPTDAIVFAMANPIPEVMPEEIEGDVEVIATGRSDYPNQINNVLAFPGVFRGALDVRASEITSEMEVAAAQRHRCNRQAGGARGGLHRPERLQPRGGSGGRGGGRRGRGALGRRAKARPRVRSLGTLSSLASLVGERRRTRTWRAS